MGRYIGDYLHLFGVFVLLATLAKNKYLTTSLIVLIIFWKLDRTYERNKDTCNLAVIFLPCSTAAVLLTNEYSVLDMLWSFSQFLEGFAMVPQYIFCYRDRGASDLGVSFYVMSLGGYRVFYAANWIYKKVQMPHYSDMQSWIGGIIEISFFTDYLLSRFTGYSLLRALVLTVDEKINEISAGLESKVLGSSRAQRPSMVDGECELRQRKTNQQSNDMV